MTAASARTGLIQTVRGLIRPDQLGHTMMHEHLGRQIGSGGSVYFREPEDPFAREMAHAPVAIENLWWLRYNFRDNIDNNTPAPQEVWRAEAELYARAGGGTLVDVTPAGAAGMSGLTALSDATGIHVVAGAGFYIDGSYPPAMNVPERTVDELARHFVEAILVGDPENAGDGSGGRAGILGELGCSWPLTDTERKVLVAAAVAQRETGVPISIHPGRNEAAPGEIRDVLRDAGADLTRVIMGHIDRCGYELATKRDLLDDGMTIEYDVFGMEGYYPAAAALADGHMPDMPNDTGRIKQISELIALGYGDRIVVGHDIHMKFQMAAFGGWGYGHYLRNVVPLMEVWGLDDDAVRRLSIDNPARLLAIA